MGKGKEIKGDILDNSVNPFLNSMAVVSRLYCFIVWIPGHVIFNVGSIPIHEKLPRIVK